MSKFKCSHHSTSWWVVQCQSTSLQGIIAMDFFGRPQRRCSYFCLRNFSWITPSGVFIKCSHRTTLLVVALDEAHIHVQHGTSFRSKICELQVLYFAKIFENQPRMKRPRLIVMTATFPTLYLPPLCQLLTIPLLTADFILRGSEIEFQQREI
jgi:hypothetical protein